MMTEVMGGTSDVLEALEKAKAAGIDEAHLTHLLRQVASGRYSDFYEYQMNEDGEPVYNTEPVGYDEEELEIRPGKKTLVRTPKYATIPQMDAPKRHCRLIRVLDEKPNDSQ